MMNNNVKSGSSINGQVITDMPIEMLRAMYEALGDAIAKYEAEEDKRKKARMDELAVDIMAAVDAARDEGYAVSIDGYMMPPVDVPLEVKVMPDEDEDEDDEDYYDDDDDEYDDYYDDEEDDYDEDEDDEEEDDDLPELDEVLKWFKSLM